MTKKTFNESVTDSIKNLVAMNNKKDFGLQEPVTPNESTETGKHDHNRKFYAEREYIRETEIRKQLFEDWLKSNSDGIDDRTEATCQWFDNKAKDETHPFQ